MTVHHTAVPLRSDADAPGRLRQHQRFHRSQGWPDIAYHLGVDRQGNVYELRPTTARGDTFTDYDPAGHLLLLAEGDFDQQQPSDEQLEGLARLMAWGAVTHGLPIDATGGHRDHASTACPGDALYARLPELRRRATELAAGEVTTRSVCGDEGRRAVARIEAGEGG
ncbi:MAG: peptidoglycan recognition protein family protein [Actinobacteria bacterium]|nr:peptidoglycan recognition protein family protein [Actinomycetota bacterium]